MDEIQQEGLDPPPFDLGSFQIGEKEHRGGGVLQHDAGWYKWSPFFAPSGVCAMFVRAVSQGPSVLKESSWPGMRHALSFGGW